MDSGSRKLKLLYIIKLLASKTDEHKGVTADEMCAYLEGVGIPAERKSIYSDIESLRHFGYDIELVRTNRFEYRLMSREFQLPELKLLVDAVESSKFITKKKSLELIGKLGGLASENEARELRRSVYVDGRVKTMNESIYYAVDNIHLAIGLDRTLNFKYFDYSRDKKRVLRHNGETYHVAPLALTYSDGNYYLLAYSASHGAIRTYRVDRMDGVGIGKAPRALPKDLVDFDPARYSSEMFDMFGGARRAVTLIFDNDLATVVVDRFGTDLTFVPSGGERFTVTADIAVSPNFFGWLASFVGRAGIVSPADVKEEYLALLKKAADGVR